ncbi:citrate synthase [Dactylosporangium sp. CA-139114]|uniref:citrate synthase n=1 Tax=Dactylosporangium sp. CA-139114 TaxID=3239931 RepID=UPI003D992E51
MSEWMSAEEAAERLGVKPATLYAYVSRGTLTRRKHEGRSVFNRTEIEELARRGRPRRQAGATELVIESAITMLGEDRHYYRGREAIALAATWRLEETALWLWTGAEPGAAAGREAGRGASRGASRDADRDAAPQEGHDWEAAPDALAAAQEAQRGLSGDVLPLERLQVIVTALAAADPVRHNLDPAAVAQTGKGLMAGMVDALPGTDSSPTSSQIASPASRQQSRPNSRQHARQDSRQDFRQDSRQAQYKGRDRGLHTRLWRKLGAARAEEGLADVLRFALVLLADHELAASTLAARVAASVRADPYAVVTTGLGTVSGALHGGASLGVESLLAEIAEPERAAQAMGERLRRGERVAGFGHAVYRAGDARGDALMDRIRAAVPGYPRLAVAEAVLEEARRRALPAMNVDFPLGVLTHLAGMPRGAGEAIFGLARTAGWLAHAMEEYANPTRLRLRAAYTGPLA